MACRGRSCRRRLQLVTVAAGILWLHGTTAVVDDTEGVVIVSVIEAAKFVGCAVRCGIVGGSLSVDSFMFSELCVSSARSARLWRCAGGNGDQLAQLVAQMYWQEASWCVGWPDVADDEVLSERGWH